MASQWIIAKDHQKSSEFCDCSVCYKLMGRVLFDHLIDCQMYLHRDMLANWSLLIDKKFWLDGCWVSSLFFPHSPESDPVKRGEGTEDALRFFISEAEDFLFLLIIVFCEWRNNARVKVQSISSFVSLLLLISAERYTQGVGEGVVATDTLRREIIHRLYISPLSHSELLKQFRVRGARG